MEFQDAMQPAWAEVRKAGEEEDEKKKANLYFMALFQV